MRKRVFLILVAVLVVNDFVVIIGSIKLFGILNLSSPVSVINEPIRNQAVLNRIVLRISQEGVKFSVKPNGIVQVSDKATAQRMRAILFREDFIPAMVEPWQIFDIPQWTATDMERNVHLQRALTNSITDLIRAIDDVADAKVIIRWPKEQLFIQDQEPVTVSVIIIPKPGSDITQNREKIEVIQKILKFAVEGLQDENIIILDNNAVLLNNFGNTAE